MKKLLKNLIAVFLFVGVLAACETTDPLINEAKTNMVLQNFDEALVLLDQYIENNPESGLPYFYKAMTYSDQASLLDDPEERKPLYHNFRENILTARDKFSVQEETPSEAAQVNDLILGAWGLEHNTAIQYATDDSVMQMVDNPLLLAAGHLENAIIVNPDSSLSYEVLAQVYNINAQPENAIQAQRKAMELKGAASSVDYERLSDYYKMAEKPDSSLLVLSQGVSQYPDSVSLSTRLADAYMDNDMRDSSIAVIERLIEGDPGNTQYRLALGTRLLQATDNLNSTIETNYNSIFELNTSLRNASGAEKNNIEAQIKTLEEENTQALQEIDEISNAAERELLLVIEQNDDSENAYNALGIIYQNRASALFDLRNYTQDLNKSNEYDAQAKEALQQAREYYEQVVEINPNNVNAWNNLAGIYYTLDMREKAEEALENAGN